MPKRARAGFGRSLEYREDTILGGHISHEIGELIPPVRADNITQIFPCDVRSALERRANFLLGRCKSAIEGVLEWGADSSARQMGEHVGRADGDARVARNWGDPEMKPRVFTERAFVIRRVEAIQQPHVGDCIERGTARQNESVASCFTYQIIDNVKKSIFEHHLGGRSFVEPLLGVRRVILFLDAENGIGIPRLLSAGSARPIYGRVPACKVSGRGCGASWPAPG